jgi:hypothetical protein
MIKIRNTRQIIWGFIIFAILFLLFSEKITDWLITLPPILILFLSPCLNLIYVAFIWSLYKDYGIKGAIAGFLISVAVTIISMPHFISLQGINVDGYTNLIADVNVWDMMPSFLKFNIGNINFGSLLMYLGISTGLVALALMLNNKKTFKEIFIKAV